MNLFKFIKGIIFIALCFVATLIWVIVTTLSAIFILPLCNYKDTLGAGSEWFAWYPIQLGRSDIVPLKSIRWLTKVEREWDGMFFYYKDIGGGEK